MQHAFRSAGSAKGASKIIIKNDKSAADNFLAVKLILAKKGIEISSQDKDVFQIKLVLHRLQSIVQGLIMSYFARIIQHSYSALGNTGIELVKDTDAFR